ncbi:hypothetical protein ABKX88_001304 [Aeromonas veronii]
MAEFKVGTKVVYKHSRQSRSNRCQMCVEFIDGDAITCSFLEGGDVMSATVKTVVLNVASLERA